MAEDGPRDLSGPRVMQAWTACALASTQLWRKSEMEAKRCCQGVRQRPIDAGSKKHNHKASGLIAYAKDIGDLVACSSFPSDSGDDQPQGRNRSI